MAWTAPATATVGQILTAAFWNQQVRDNMKEVWRELVVTEFSANVTSTSTTFAGGTNFGSAGALTFDGSQKIRVELYTPSITSSTTAASAQVSLADGGPGGTDLGLMALCANTDNTPVRAVREFTPPAATKTYSLVLWTSAAGTATVGAGAGGAGTRFPGHMRLSVRA